MRIVRKYLEIRRLDVRGLWYDIDNKDSRIHLARIHFVSILPIKKGVRLTRGLVVY